MEDSAALREEGRVTGDPGVRGDVDLVRSAGDGDVDALEALYRRHVDRVYALCLRMTADPGEAEELTQDVWVRVWRKLETFRGEASFTTWLHEVTRNLVLDRRRARARRRDREVLTGEPELHGGGQRQRPAEERVDLEGALRALPDRAREVFVLHDVEGYKHREIAEMLGVAEGTSKAHLFRARRLLRERLDP